MFANCILFATFRSVGTLVQRNKTWRYSARKRLAFGLLMTDIPVYVSGKFEMYIFKIAVVISENVRIAFLYVLSICALRPAWSCSLDHLYKLTFTFPMKTLDFIWL